MSYYLDNNYSQDYGRRTEIYRNYQNNQEKKRTINQNLSSLKMRDNSAILRRAIKKQYKEDINKNIIKSDNYDDNDDNNNEYYENNLHNEYKENKNYINNYNNSNYNINYYSNSNNNPYKNYNEIDNIDNNYFDQALISRIHNNRIRNNINSNIRNYYLSSINKDNIYDEFIINYNLGINKEDNFERNTLNRNPTQFIMNSKNYNKINNQLYNRKTSNNFFRDKYILNSKNNDTLKPINYTNSQIEYLYRPQIENNEEIKVPYHKRRINNYAYKDNKENGMANTNYLNISKNKEKLYLRNNLENDNFFNRNNVLNNFNTLDPSNNYERNYNIMNYNGNNFENINNNIHYNEDFYNMNENYNNQNTDLDLYSEANERISDFLQHIIQYCFLYYLKIIQKVFDFLKNQKNKPKIKKYNKIVPNKEINKNINIKNKKVKTTNYLKKYQTYSNMHKSKLNNIGEKSERIPYHKNNNNESNTNNIIERIKSKNESVSPNKNNNGEMYRNFDELNKKYEIISNRKNRMSYNNTKRSLNDLSFNSENKAIYRNSVDRNKEIFENNINKERERKKKILERKKKQKEKKKLLKDKEKTKNNIVIKNNKNKLEEKNNTLSNLIKKNEELKKKIQKAIEDNKLDLKKDNKNIKDKNKNNNNINKIPSLERKKIREKYKKKNLNKVNDKYEMIDVKKISTKDKSIYINIKYLNFIPMKNKNKKENNNKCKLYQVCNNFNISLLGIKDNNENKNKIKKEYIENNNNYFHKLSSIQEENKIDLNEVSDSLSHKSEENVK